MRKNFFAGLIAISLLFTVRAGASPFGHDDEDYSSFSKVKCQRQTIILVDDRLMTEGQTHWGELMINTLFSSLMPSEPVTVIRLKTETGISEQIWSGCFPDYSEAEKTQKSKETSWFSKPWDKVLATQQAAFRQDFGSALGKIYTEGKRAASLVSVDPANPPQTQLLRAIKDATSRFDSSRGPIFRTILYSDMLENSDLGNSLKSGTPSDNLKIVSTVGLNLQQTVLYAYGVGSTFAGGNNKESTRAFWDGVLDAGMAHVAGFGSDLAVQAGVPIGAVKYEFAIKIDNDTRNGMMRILYDHDGRMIDSLAVAGASLRSMISDGSYTCSTDGKCKVEGRLPRGLVTENAAHDPALIETLTMSGSREILKGTIGVAGATFKGGKAEFEITAKLVQ